MKRLFVLKGVLPGVSVAILTLLAQSGCTNKDEATPTGETGDTGPEMVTDTFKQEINTPLDLLWVVDSGWTAAIDTLHDIEVMQSAFENLLVADPAWRIGMISANTTGGAFGVIAKKWDTYPPPQGAFEVPPSTAPPRVRDAIYTALGVRKDIGPNAEFIRPDAHLYVLVITDDEDGSTDTTEQDFNQWFNSFTPSRTKRLGVLTTSQKHDYWESRAVGGVVANGGPFRAAFDTLLRDAMGQRTAFTLSKTPVEPPLTATLVYREHGTELLLGEDYTYDPATRLLSLTEIVPLPGAELQVTYEVAEEQPEEEPPAEEGEE